MVGTSLSSLPTPAVFGGENYEFWSVKMKGFLAHDLWETVEGGYEAPRGNVNYTVEQLREQKNQSIKNMKALSFLHSAVFETIFPRIVAVTTAEGAWDKLQEEFKGSERVRAVRVQALSREFENLRMKEAEIVKDYTSRVVDVVNQLKLHGEEVSEKKVVQKVLITLPEKYDAVTIAIEHTKDLSSLTLTELTGALLAYEQRLSSRSESSVEGAFAAKHKQKTSRGSGERKHHDGKKKGEGS